MEIPVRKNVSVVQKHFGEVIIMKIIVSIAIRQMLGHIPIGMNVNGVKIGFG